MAKERKLIPFSKLKEGCPLPKFSALAGAVVTSTGPKQSPTQLCGRAPPKCCQQRRLRGQSRK